jgi:iron complex transport system substrate-binding protein
MLYALGVEPVGISHSCDYPPAITDRPAVTSTVIDYENRPSRDIDEQMESIDGAVYDVDEDRLEELDPDLVVTQSTCDVCAVESSAVFEAVERRDVDADVLTLDPHSFDDVLSDLRRIGAAVGKEAEAERVLSGARERVDAVLTSVDGLDRPRTAVLDWTDPLIRGGHWVRDVVRLAGGDESFQPDGPSEPIRWRDLREYDPERLIVAPCGFSTSRAHDAAAELASHAEWEHLTAVQSGHVYAVDGNALVNRPGPRLVESLEILAKCLHPDDVSVSSDGWVRRVELVPERSF